MIDIAAYLERISYDGPLTPTAETLGTLHEAHLRAVPFENVDILDGRPLVLAEEALFDKIVRHGRGGICYELNGLFAALLRAIGFSVSLLAARDVHADGTLSPPFDHLALLVTAHGRWLADVGWGDQFVRPLRVDRRAAQSDGRHAYRISAATEERVLARQRADGAREWEPLYRFTLAPHPLPTFGPACCYHQSASEAPFTQRLLCTRLTPTGRVTLSETCLIETDHRGRRERRLLDDGACRAALWAHFGLVRARRSVSAWSPPSQTAVATTSDATRE